MPQFRNVTSNGEQPGGEEGMEMIDNPHVEIRMVGTSSDGRSVRKNRSSWRSLDRSAVAAGAPVNLESRVEWYRVPADVINYKTAELRAFYSGDDIVASIHQLAMFQL